MRRQDAIVEAIRYGTKVKIREWKQDEWVRVDRMKGYVVLQTGEQFTSRRINEGHEAPDIYGEEAWEVCNG